MGGFKQFIMRGNLIELAVAFIMGGAFATVVTAFTKVVLGGIGTVTGGPPNYDSFQPGGVPVGQFVTATIAFLILAAVVYWGLVLPYEKLKQRFVRPPESAVAKEVELLTEIRDLLTDRGPGPRK